MRLATSLLLPCLLHFVVLPGATQAEPTTPTTVLSISDGDTLRYGLAVAEVFSDINVGLALVKDGQAYPLRGPTAT